MRSVTNPDVPPHVAGNLRAFSRGLGGIAIETAAICGAIVAVYGLLPFSGNWGAAGLIVGGIAALVVIAVLIRRVRRDLLAERPVPEAIAAVVVTATLTIITSSATYYAMASANPDSFRGLGTKIDATYFAVTVMSTVGFGDIAATTNAARISVMVQMMADVIVIGVVARLMINSVKLHTGRARDEPVGRDGRAGR